MIDLIAAAFLGFALGVIWQEIHFRKLTAQLDEAVRRMDRLDGGCG
ncbi:MAG TPA: hypothetical protein VJ890_21220 [Vineibacter sp.]|nr:hypothetical protein [Vineibacter sp.]